MAKQTKEAADPAILRHVDRCATFLVKALCLDTNATEATITQNLTHYSKSIGRYRITIKKI